MNIRDLSTLESAAKWLDELIQTCRKFGPVYSSNPKLTAQVTTRAKTLRPSLERLRDSILNPKGGESL